MYFYTLVYSDHDVLSYSFHVLCPKGTCINNTSVFMFKKGCFELGSVIYPAVIKVT